MRLASSNAMTSGEWWQCNQEIRRRPEADVSVSLEGCLYRSTPPKQKARTSKDADPKLGHSQEKHANYTHKATRPGIKSETFLLSGMKRTQSTTNNLVLGGIAGECTCTLLSSNAASISFSGQHLQSHFCILQMTLVKFVNFFFCSFFCFPPLPSRSLL